MVKTLSKTHYVGPGESRRWSRARCRCWSTTSRACWRASSACSRAAATTSTSLTVTETEHEKHLSRITIVTRGTPDVIVQIKHQLERLVPVHRVHDLTRRGRIAGARAGAHQGYGTGREAHRGAAPGRDFPRERHRRLDRALRVRDHRTLDQDRAVHPDHDRARPRRGLAHGRRCHRPRSRQPLKELFGSTPATTAAAGSRSRQTTTRVKHKRDLPCAFITIVMPISI